MSSRGSCEALARRKASRGSCEQSEVTLVRNGKALERKRETREWQGQNQVISFPSFGDCFAGMCASGCELPKWTTNPVISQEVKSWEADISAATEGPWMLGTQMTGWLRRSQSFPITSASQGKQWHPESQQSLWVRWENFWHQNHLRPDSYCSICDFMVEIHVPK